MELPTEKLKVSQFKELFLANIWHKKEGGFMITATQHFYAMAVVVLSRVLFRADTVGYAWQYLKNMFGFSKDHNITYTLGYYVGNICKVV